MTDRLKELEKQSIEFIKNISKFFNQNELGVLYSVGKDSSVLIHLIKKSGIKIPIIIHIDTGLKIPEMIEYRNKFLCENKYDNLILEVNNQTIYDSKIECCYNKKTIPLQSIIYCENKFPIFKVVDNQKVKINQSNQIKGLFVGIRVDEENTRKKEEFVSKRYKNSWDIEQCELQILNYYSIDYDADSHYRLHPLLLWTEKDIWEYIKEEKIKITDLYFSNNGERYRSLGCGCCTCKIESNAHNVDDIIEELSTTLHNIPERSVRKQDTIHGLEELRLYGYM